MAGKKSNGKTQPAQTIAHDGMKFKRAAGGMLPFWTPQNDELDPAHPKKVSGVVSNIRVLEGKGKGWKDRTAFDVIDSKTQVGWCVPCNESLERQVKAEKLGGGETVLVTFDGTAKAKKKGRNDANLFTLYVEV